MDGVGGLQFHQIGATWFRATGFTYWLGSIACGNAPFEVEFYYPTQESLDYERAVIRFGWLDRHGRITPVSIHPRLRRPNQPPKDSDWAMAIELTPPVH